MRRRELLIRVLPGAFDEAAAPVEHVADDRWLLGYAAAVGDTSAPFFDLDRPDGIVAHPVFPVCLEWPLVLHGIPGLEIREAELRRGVHVTHEIAQHRPIRPGDRLRTTARLVTAESRSIGCYVEARLESVTAAGLPVASSRYGMLYRGVTLAGAVPRRPSPARSLPAPAAEVASFAVSAGDAAIYTECARIWNPIHTDSRVARAAGLPGTILHGTAVLARAVSAVVARVLDGDPSRIAALGCRFTGMVLPGTTVTVHASAAVGQPPAAGSVVGFEAHCSDGTVALSDGFVELRPAS